MGMIWSLKEPLPPNAVELSEMPYLTNVGDVCVKVGAQFSGVAYFVDCDLMEDDMAVHRMKKVDLTVVKGTHLQIRARGKVCITGDVNFHVLCEHSVDAYGCSGECYVSARGNVSITDGSGKIEIDSGGDVYVSGKYDEASLVKVSKNTTVWVPNGVRVEGTDIVGRTSSNVKKSEARVGLGG
jgi:hypothetical protein